MAEPKSVAQKLLVKPGMKFLLLYAPPEVLEQLQPLPEGAQIRTDAVASTADVALLFVRSQADVDQHARTVMDAVKSGGVVWFAYPKKTGKIKADISRDTGWQTVRDAGWEPVTQIAIDETWSALRFRPRSEIKVMTRSLDWK